MFTAALREAIRSGGWRSKLGYLMAKPAFAILRSKFDPRRYNGAMFLGLNGVVVKSHGGTDEMGFASALDMAIDMANSGVISRIIDDRAHIAAALPEAAAS